jgi:hypothetical protein
MDKYLKSAVMAAVTIVWTLYMLAALVMWIIGRTSFPDPTIWGVVGMVWLALNPPFGGKKDPPTEGNTPK